MPELPEVETMRRDLLKRVKGLTIRDVKVLDARVIRNVSARRFANQSRNQKIVDVSRRGKAVVVHFEGRRYFIVQPMMTGYLLYISPGRDCPVSKETKIVFHLSNGGHFIYNDQRLFGRIHLVENLMDVRFFQTLGREPISSDFAPDWLYSNVKQRKIPIKNLLMNQNIVAGIGNIYASEILFKAGIRPQRRAKSLTKKETEAICVSARSILKEAIRLRGTSMRNYRDADGAKGKFMNRLQVYGRDDEKCLSCGSPIKKIVQNGRSTFYCQMCQK